MKELPSNWTKLDGQIPKFANTETGEVIELRHAVHAGYRAIVYQTASDTDPDYLEDVIDTDDRDEAIEQLKTYLNEEHEEGEEHE